MTRLTRFIALSLILISNTGHAKPRIAILDFELNDITSLPNTPAERQRTASMAPLLINALSRNGEYEVLAIDTDTQKSANAGFGYLFRFHDLAAALGQQLDVDWIIVSQHSKPSFLYSYLITHLIRVKPRTLFNRYDVELKGNHATVTEHGIHRLAEKIHTDIKKSAQPSVSRLIGSP